jgi:hypothetical protein
MVSQKRSLIAYRCPSVLRKTAFLSRFYIKTIILPRQARDKHRENSKNDAVFRTDNVIEDCRRHLALLPASQQCNFGDVYELFGEFSLCLS